MTKKGHSQYLHIIIMSGVVANHTPGKNTINQQCSYDSLPWNVYKAWFNV